ncbi:hypothetical protein [Blastochloris tepida]|uniref:Thioesterase domain-containing protein n=1 Tax=Blastochloris tepida TaxID=2233851 RepID=A0A348G4H9_9HYPH|nr:hypothetical protein [Blastochloris tepida]BBF94462.1 hypothetical protein BLTE_31470 [Blastochloris tepida]
MLGFQRFFFAVGAFACFALATAQAAPPAQTTETRVYLLRGLANIFSLGLDDLADKLSRRGIHTAVANHADADALADEIIARRAAGWRGPVVLVGHSLGADAVYPMAARLAAAKVPVSLVVSFDPVGYQTVPRNVAKAVNYYLSGCCNAVRAGDGFKGSLTNFDLEGKSDLGHLNIEKSPQLHEEVIARIVALKAPPRKRTTPSQPAPDTAKDATKPATEVTGAAPASTTAGVPAATPATTH